MFRPSRQEPRPQSRRDFVGSARHFNAGFRNAGSSILDAASLNAGFLNAGSPPSVGFAPPPWFWLGLALVVAAWWLAWAGPPPYSEHTFFPLWLGYILTVDGLTRWRAGDSLLARDPGRFALLFACSVPLWWLFEFANRFLGNWRYVLPSDYGPLAYALLSSLSFSTVMPALFVTAECWRTVPFFARPRQWLRIAPSRRGLVAIALAGAAMFATSLVFPRHAFPLVWLGAFFLLDPLNALRGGKSIAAEVAQRRWDTVLVLCLAGLTCGFFWELWNVHSLPKWVYAVPYADRWHLFEMPLLGYGGYPPFALEVYAAYHALRALLVRRGVRDDYLRFDAAAADARAALPGRSPIMSGASRPRGGDTRVDG